MSWLVGAAMLRLDDGQRGTVAEVEGERRIVYEDRGARVIAGKKEKWVVEAEPPTKLRATEIIEVALYADRALRSIDLHEPMKFWEKPTLAGGVHDQALFDLIVGHLQKRA